MTDFSEQIKVLEVEKAQHQGLLDELLNSEGYQDILRSYLEMEERRERLQRKVDNSQAAIDLLSAPALVSGNPNVMADPRQAFADSVAPEPPTRRSSKESVGDGWQRTR